MRRPLWQVTLGLSAAFALLGAGWTLLACAFVPWAPTYGPMNHLDVTEAEFAAGHLGIVHPDADTRDLVVAWRYLSGLPLTPVEQRSFDARPESLGWGPQGQPSTAAEAPIAEWGDLTGQKFGSYYGPDASLQTWAPGVYFQGKVGIWWNSFLNCPVDAFRNAVATLRARRALYGESSPQLQAWVSAQEMVFDNCPGTRQSYPGAPVPPAAPQIPSPLPATASALARADRKYQIAAANFYALHYRTAARKFEAIAKDSASPWRASGGYLAARAMVREATVQPGKLGSERTGYIAGVDRPEEMLWLGKAETEVDTVLAARADAAWWGPARELRGFIEARLHPHRRALVLARRLAKPGDARFGQDTADLAYLSGAVADDRGQSSMLGWLAKQSTAPLALREWQKTHALPWLISALADSARGKAPANLLAAARSISPSSPGFDTVEYEMLQRELEEHPNANAAVQQGLAALPLAKMPSATRDQFLALDLATAPTLAKALAAAPRISFDGRYRGFDSDAQSLFNQAMPHLMLAQAAETSSAMPVPLQRQLLVAAWTRAVVFGDQATAETLSPRLAAAAPLLAPDLAQYESATADTRFERSEQREFDALWLLLHFPGMTPYVPGRLDGGVEVPLSRIDSAGNNWWLPMPFGLRGNDFPQVPHFSSGYRPPPFLTGANIYRWMEEAQALNFMGPAINVFCERLLQLGRSGAIKDPRMAEALSLAVAATAEAPGNANTGKLSKQCYEWLQTKYPNSVWAKETTQWYTGYCGRYMDCQPR